MFLEICFDVIWAHALQHIVLSQNTHNKDSATYTTQNCCRNTLLQNCVFAFNVRTEIDNHWVQRDSTCHATHTQKNIRSRMFLSTLQCGKCRGHCVYLVPGFLSKRVSLSFITAANCVQPHTHHKDSATCRNTEVVSTCHVTHTQHNICSRVVVYIWCACTYTSVVDIVCTRFRRSCVYVIPAFPVVHKHKSTESSSNHVMDVFHAFTPQHFTISTCRKHMCSRVLQTALTVLTRA